MYFYSNSMKLFVYFGYWGDLDWLFHVISQEVLLVILSEIMDAEGGFTRAKEALSKNMYFMLPANGPNKWPVKMLEVR